MQREGERQKARAAKQPKETRDSGKHSILSRGAEHEHAARTRVARHNWWVLYLMIMATIMMIGMALMALKMKIACSRFLCALCRPDTGPCYSVCASLLLCVCVCVSWRVGALLGVCVRFVIFSVASFARPNRGRWSRVRSDS